MIQVYQVSDKANANNEPIAEFEYQSDVQRYSAKTTKVMLAVEYYSGYLIVDVWKTAIA